MRSVVARCGARRAVPRPRQVRDQGGGRGGRNRSRRGTQDADNRGHGRGEPTTQRCWPSRLMSAENSPTAVSAQGSCDDTLGERACSRYATPDYGAPTVPPGAVEPIRISRGRNGQSRWSEAELVWCWARDAEASRRSKDAFSSSRSKAACGRRAFRSSSSGGACSRVIEVHGVSAPQALRAWQALGTSQMLAVGPHALSTSQRVPAGHTLSTRQMLCGSQVLAGGAQKLGGPGQMVGPPGSQAEVAGGHILSSGQLLAGPQVLGCGQVLGVSQMLPASQLAPTSQPVSPMQTLASRSQPLASGQLSASWHVLMLSQPLSSQPLSSQPLRSHGSSGVTAPGGVRISTCGRALRRRGTPGCLRGRDGYHQLLHLEHETPYQARRAAVTIAPLRTSA